MGHRERFNGDSGTGGDGKWDTGRGWRGIPGQVGRKMGHRARLADLRGRLRGEALDREGRWGRRVRRLIRCESMKVGGGE